MRKPMVVVALLVVAASCKKDEPRRDEARPVGEAPAPSPEPAPAVVEPAPEPVAAAPTPEPAKPCNPAIEDCPPPAGPAAPTNPDAPPPGLVTIAGGCFQMGSEDVISKSSPVREVCLGDYQLDNYEVTNEQYDACVAKKQCEPRTEHTGFTDPKQPVVGVDFARATAYCKAMGKRLPTEAEWEFAARGTEGRAFPWGNDLDCSHANLGAEHGRGDCADVNPGKPAPVGSYAKDRTPEGVYDLGGNVVEWIADFYDSGFYAKSTKLNPFATETGDDMSEPYHVVRGAHYAEGAREWVHAAAREYHRPHVQNMKVGFRCAK